MDDPNTWYNQNPFPVLRGDILGKHTVVANTEGSLFPSMNGGLQYFRNDLPGGGSNHLLKLFNDHVDDLVTNEVPCGVTALCKLLGIGGLSALASAPPQNPARCVP